MDDRDRLLAEAWRDLARWHVGMVTGGGGVVCLVREDGVFLLYQPHGEKNYVFASPNTTRVPALGSPANWGHFATAVKRLVGTLPLWLHEQWDERLPWRLLGWVCRMEEVRGSAPLDLPPSVLAWWKSQQGEVSGG